VRYQNDPAFIHDPESWYIRILISDLPAYMRGLMLAAFAAAYMSTIGTQLNWGASYLVNDVYKRFMVREKNERHYVRASQAVTMLLMILSAIVTFYMGSIAGAWKYLMAIGAGTGLVYILRWFWWRVNAWSEVSAMAAAFVTSTAMQYAFKLDENQPRDFAYLVLGTVAVTTAVWLTVTFLTGPEERSTLLSFYRRVRPSASLWGPIAQEATDIVPQKDGMFNLIDWLCGVFMIYAFLFGTGKIILGDYLLGVVFLVAGLFFGSIIYRDLNKRGWETVGK
jgi:SSS family solute:Na+ symporter